MRACVRECVRACVCVDRMNLKYALRRHIHIYQFISYTRILKPFEDSEPTGLKVDIAGYRLIGDNGRLQYSRFCLFEMYVNLVFVMFVQGSEFNSG